MKIVITMSKKLFVLYLVAVSTFTLKSCTSGNAEATTTSKENVTFYEVPLVCGADAEIGCGSRAKPALLDMKKNPAIKEAWLNRQGTVIAIVWNGIEQTTAVAKPIFDKYEIDYTKLKGKDARKNEVTFRQSNLWYKEEDVDKLSIEEAEHIAGTLVSFALDKKLISQEESDKLRPAVENYFKTELVKVRTPEQLYDDDANKFRNDLTAISTSIIGEERTNKITAMYYQYRQEECRENESGCTNNSIDPCCKKNEK
jgi:hypothetical protein